MHVAEGGGGSVLQDADESIDLPETSLPPAQDPILIKSPRGNDPTGSRKSSVSLQLFSKTATERPQSKAGQPPSPFSFTTLAAAPSPRKLASPSNEPAHLDGATPSLPALKLPQPALVPPASPSSVPRPLFSPQHTMLDLETTVNTNLCAFRRLARKLTNAREAVL